MVLVDYSSGEIWDKNKDITSYLTSRLFAIELVKEGDSYYWKIIGNENDPLPNSIDPLRQNDSVRKIFDIDPRNDINFLKLTGSNTFYITHPEEIIADNVAILGMLLSRFDIDEIDESGLKVLLQIASVFGEETRTICQHYASLALKNKLTGVSSRQKKRLMERSINEGKRARTRF